MNITNEETAGPRRQRPILLSATVGLTLAATALSTLALPATAAGALSGRQVVVSTTTIPKFGKILESKGTALYTLTPSATACGAQCLKIWPALSLPTQFKSATAGSGVSHSALGVTHGPDGIRQVTYQGRPVYRYTGDTRGHVNGNFSDEWGTWTAVVVGAHAAAGGSGSTSGGSTAGSGGVSF